ncbi:MAG: hypothetical protein Q8P24_19690 [Desulfobacterales bacterium]|nr:hypothetical protein [Desulfobacterales bacterium]
MNYKELLEKYNFLLSENTRLTDENIRLKEQLWITTSESSENYITQKTTEKIILDDESTDDASFSDVNNTSDFISKIKLFMSLFKGRDDVYTKKWESSKIAKSGFSPVCLNQWMIGVCGKPKVSCAKCADKLYAAPDEDVIENHLRVNIL